MRAWPAYYLVCERVLGYSEMQTMSLDEIEKLEHAYHALESAKARVRK